MKQRGVSMALRERRTKAFPETHTTLYSLSE